MEEAQAMTVVLENRHQLAAPRRLCPVPPMVVEPSGWQFEDGPDSEGDRVPAFVRQSRQLVERHPTSAAALARLAQAELAADNPAEAVASARAALTRTATKPDMSAAVSAAVTLIACGELHEAEAGLADMPINGPLAVLYAGVAAARGDLAEAFYRLGEEDSVDAWNLRGWIRLQQGQHGQAIHCYRQVLRQAGPSPAALTNIGLAHAVLGDASRAVSVTRQAMALAPSQRTRVGLNLAWYHLACGESTEALAVLRELQHSRPHDIEPSFAEASVHLTIGDPTAALKVLRRARTMLWAYTSPVQQSELNANLAYVGWRLGETSAEHAAKTLINELRRIDHRSLRIAGMLPSLLWRFSDAVTLRPLLAKLRTAHSNVPLHDLEVHLALLERRFEDAVEGAVQWADESPLDPYAATSCTYLLADVAGDYTRAADVGRRALRRMPGVAPLANNVAYALALAGRAKDAQRYLINIAAPQYVATQALIWVVMGRLEEARDGYRRAHEMAVDAGDPLLAKLVLLNARRAFKDYPADECPPDDGAFSEIASLAEDDLRFAIARRMIDGRGP